MGNRPYFVIESGPGQGEEIQIKNNSLVLGRDSSCNYIIPNKKISRQHARIFLQDGKWMIEDLASKNHTRLDNVKIEPENPQPLYDDAQIQLAAQVVLRFHDPSATLSDDSRVVTDGLWVDPVEDIYIHNKRLEPKLSRRQFLILFLMYERSFTKTQIVSLEDIAATGWPGVYDISDGMIDAEIHRLRKRLAELEPEHNFIRAERGRGRLFVQMREQKV